MSVIIAGMARMRAVWIVVIVLGAFAANAQTRIDASTQASVTMPAELPADVMRLLEGVRDNVFSFDDPAFYSACRFVADHTSEETGTTPEDALVVWRHLLERPGDYRGRCVAIDGLVLRQSKYDVTNRSGIPRLYQLDLGDTDSRAIATVVLTQNPGELDDRARVRVGGYFIKVRSYETNQGETGSGPLLVGFACERTPGPSDAVPGYPPHQSNTLRWLYWGIALLAVAWFVLRGHQRRQRGRRIVIKRGNDESEATTEEDLRWLLDREGRDLLE